jgi:hypothetical protein
LLIVGLWALVCRFQFVLNPNLLEMEVLVYFFVANFESTTARNILMKTVVRVRARLMKTVVRVRARLKNIRMTVMNIRMTVMNIPMTMTSTLTTVTVTAKQIFVMDFVLFGYIIGFLQD